MKHNVKWTPKYVPPPTIAVEARPVWLKCPRKPRLKKMAGDQQRLAASVIADPYGVHQIEVTLSAGDHSACVPVTSCPPRPVRAEANAEG